MTEHQKHERGKYNLLAGLLAIVIGFCFLVLPVFRQVPDNWPSVEFSVIIMLAGIGWITGRNLAGKFLESQRQLRETVDRNTRIAAAGDKPAADKPAPPSDSSQKNDETAGS